MITLFIHPTMFRRKVFGCKKSWERIQSFDFSNVSEDIFVFQMSLVFLNHQVSSSQHHSTPQKPAFIPSINASWPYAGANTTIHSFDRESSSQDNAPQEKFLNQLKLFVKNTIWKLLYASEHNQHIFFCDCMDLIIFNVIFWNGSNKNVLNHS